MIVDTSFVSELYHAEKIDSYDELISYMRQLGNDYYTKMNILTQKHHILPAFECEDLDEIEAIQLPISIHFIAHILRAREQSLTPGKEHYAVGNYTEAYCVLKKFPELRGPLYLMWKEAEECYQKFFRADTYEAQFGKRKATIIKRKISNAMSNLDPVIISNRNEKIAKYAANRPAEHNAAIAKSKWKSVIHIQTGKYYQNAEDASKKTGVSISTIRLHCQGKKRDPKWEYLL